MSLTKSEKEYIAEVGNRIVSIREKRNLKQIDLAIKIDIEDSALRRVESGRTNPTLKTLLKIAEGLDVDISELLPKTKKQP